MQLSRQGEPLYGPRDEVEIHKIAAIGLPFYLAGGYASPEMLWRAAELGASGVQVGTAFAFCDESGITPEIKRRVIQLSGDGAATVFTDPLASPTGFPFKVLDLPGTISDQQVYACRNRLCDLGYLRQSYRRQDGLVGFRCPAEPVESFVRKGGLAENTIGRKCICNALFSTIGLGQVDRHGAIEPAIVTAGDDVVNLADFIKPGQTRYSAGDVLDYLLATAPAEAKNPATALT